MFRIHANISALIPHTRGERLSVKRYSMVTVSSCVEPTIVEYVIERLLLTPFAHRDFGTADAWRLTDDGCDVQPINPDQPTDAATDFFVEPTRKEGGHTPRQYRRQPHGQRLSSRPH